MKRKFRIRLVGEKKFHMNTFLTILSLVMVTGVMVLATTLGVFVQSAQSLEAISEGGHSLINEVIKNSIISIGVILLLSSAVVYFYSNKIAGPMHRLKELLTVMQQGQLNEPVKFRKGDEFEEIAFSVNSFRESLKKRISQGMNRADVIRGKIDSLINKHSRDGHRSKELKGVLHQLKLVKNDVAALKKSLIVR